MVVSRNSRLESNKEEEDDEGVTACIRGVEAECFLTKSSFSIAWIYATSHRIPASASTNQGPEKGVVILRCGLVVGSRRFFFFFVTLKPRVE